MVAVGRPGYSKDGGHPEAPAEAAHGGLVLTERRAHSDALPENTPLTDGGHPQAPAEAAHGGLVLTERRARSDALPENTRYVDSGCDVHPSCLTCPLVRCRYDEPGGTRRLLSEGRERRIVSLRRSGHGIADIAARLGVSRRTVFRALARARQGRR